MKFTNRIRKCENFKMNSFLSVMERVTNVIVDNTPFLNILAQFWGVIEAQFRLILENIDKSIEILEKFNEDVRIELHFTIYDCWYEANKDLSPHHSSGVESFKPGEQSGRPMGPSCSKIIQYYL